jgi:UDP-N-acetylglucosamine:LPS N-acetylglucosamine transferase
MHDSRRIKVLAISSGGGHWTELLRVMPAFEGCDIAFATVRRDYAPLVPEHRLHVFNDGTRWNAAGLAIMALRILLILLRERPDVIVTTGAAPGYFALRIGKWLSAKTIWLDSVANVEELSMAGRMARPFSDLWLTQWPHLAASDGPEYAGAVLG